MSDHGDGHGSTVLFRVPRIAVRASLFGSLVPRPHSSPSINVPHHLVACPTEARAFSIA
jgi:hypothetical protein